MGRGDRAIERVAGARSSRSTSPRGSTGPRARSTARPSGRRHRDVRCGEDRGGPAPRAPSTRARCASSTSASPPTARGGRRPHRTRGCGRRDAAPRADTHKRASGVVVIVAGSRGMTGAPSLIARGRRPDRARASSWSPCRPPCSPRSRQGSPRPCSWRCPTRPRAPSPTRPLGRRSCPRPSGRTRARAGPHAHAETAGFVASARPREPRAGGAGRRRPERVRRDGR